jgi:CheY-like chemotaxis protein
MSKEFMEKMFEPFSQEHRSESGNITGTGLGLSIVKRIVDIMGGTITVESELYKGTKFTVDLPLECWDKTPEEATAQAAVRNRLEQQVLAGMQVLLCEDNYLNAEIAQLLLKNKKMQVDWAHNGQEGVEKFQAVGSQLLSANLDGYAHAGFGRPGSYQNYPRSAAARCQNYPHRGHDGGSF